MKISPIKSGCTYNELTAIRRVDDYISPKGQHYQRWLFLCSCGKYFETRASSVLCGDTKSCGHLNRQRENLIGHKYHRLLVTDHADDIVYKNGNHLSAYECLCDCGNKVIVSAANLKSGITKSCGCLTKELNSKRSFVDLSGKRFSECVVLYRTDDYIAPGGEHDPQYVCKCDCEKEFVARGSNLRNGHTWCCGCHRKSSKAEQIINDYLADHKINFIRNYKFDDLRSMKNWKLPFDFALLDNNNSLLCLIEYQGSQHFEARKNDIFGFEQRKYTDKAKKDYCLQNNIHLYEISYQQDIIQELNKIINATYYANTVPSLESEEGVTTIPQGST